MCERCTIWHVSIRLICDTLRHGDIRSKYLAPSHLCTLQRSLSVEFVDLEEFSSSVILLSGGEPNALGETFPRLPFATRHLLDTPADKNETSGLEECLRFLAVRCIRAEFYAIALCHAMYINAHVNYFIASFMLRPRCLIITLLFSSFLQSFINVNFSFIFSLKYKWYKMIYYGNETRDALLTGDFFGMMI